MSDWRKSRRDRDVVEMASDPRYRILRWPAGNTVGFEGPLRPERFLAQFCISPVHGYYPWETIGQAQLKPKEAADLCRAHQRGEIKLRSELPGYDPRPRSWNGKVLPKLA